MSCTVLTSERLALLLSGKLPAADRAAVKEHLATPCEGCLDALSSVDGERILAALAGPAADLSRAEADQMFERALPSPARAATTEEPRGLWAQLVEWLGGSAWRPALSVAVLLVVAAPAIWIGARSAGPRDWDGLKGSASAPAVKVALIGVIATEGNQVDARRAASGEQLKPGEVLLVRFRLSASAAVHLEISGPKASLGVWPDGRPDTDAPPPPLPPGEHTLAASSQALAIHPQEFGSPLTVTLVAAPQPFAPSLVPGLAALGEDPSSLSVKCPSCAREVLQVLSP